MKKSFAVFGLGRFGKAVALELAAQGADVLAIDRDEATVNEIADRVTVALCADFTDITAMGRILPEGLDGAVIAMAESTEATIMAIFEAKRLGIPKIWAKARDEVQAQILTTVGATRVVIPEKEHAINIARSLFSGSFLDFVELSDKIAMIKLPVREEWVGKSLIELALRQKHGINVIAIDKGGHVTMDFSPSEGLAKDDVLFVVAQRKGIKKLFHG